MLAHRLSVIGVVVALAGVLILAAAQGCGAQDKLGPDAVAHPEQCQSLSQLAPALMTALSGDNAARLRTFIDRNHLMDTQPDGSPAPGTVLLGVILGSLNQMAHDPAEAGAPPGQLCNMSDPPAARDANRMCEVRRIIKRFVREGRGLDALHSLDPVIAGVLGYIAGEPPATVTHYELATVLGASCSKAYCKTEDTLDMLTGLLGFLEPTATQPHRPQDLLAQVNALLKNPQLQPLMDTMTAKMDKAAVIAFGKVLIDNTLALPTNPAEFHASYQRNIEVKINDLLTNTLAISRSDPKWADLRTAIDQFIGPVESTNLNSPPDDTQALLYSLLDPSRPEPVLQPLQGVLSCTKMNDPDSALMSMVYELAFVNDTLGLKNLMSAIQEVADQDDRLAILTLTKNLVKMVRADEEGVAAARKMCAQAMDTRAPQDGGKPNAELVTPVAYDLFAGGAMQELICVADTVLFGCTGGQPACDTAK